jgi:hypothetical protein
MKLMKNNNKKKEENINKEKNHLNLIPALGIFIKLILLVALLVDNLFKGYFNLSNYLLISFITYVP